MQRGVGIGETPSPLHRIVVRYSFTTIGTSFGKIFR